VFKLNILLDVAKNTASLSRCIFDNVKERLVGGMDLSRYKIVVKVIDGFIRKCKEEVLTSNSIKHSSKALPNNH
jgi:hypothetical protein